MASHQPSRPIRPSPTSYVSAAILWFNWLCQWIAYGAAKLALFQVLDYAGKLGVLIAVIFWFADYPERQRTAIRTAWSVVNEKGGGRKDALLHLADHNVDLRGLNGASGYFGDIALSGRDLRGSDLSDANFENATLEKTNLQASKLSGANFTSAHLARADLSESDLANADFENAKLDAANLQHSGLSRVNFKNASLVHADFRNSRLYPVVPNFEKANIDGADFTNVVISDLVAYRALLAARNWQAAKFGEATRSILECVATGVTVPSGCGINVNIPAISERGDLGSAQLLVQAIIQSVHCELSNALKSVRTSDIEISQKYEQRRVTDFLLNWDAEMTLILTFDEKSSLITGAADATRAEKVTFYYPISHLLNEAFCTTGVPQGNDSSPLVRSDLKLKEWLTDFLGTVGAMPTQIAGNGATFLSHNIKFYITTSAITGGNIMPSWSLSTATLNPTSTTRGRTHDLTITLGPGSPTGFIGNATRGSEQRESNDNADGAARR